MTNDSTRAARALIGAEVLLVDKDERVQKGMTQLLSAAGLHVTCVSEPTAAYREIERRFFTVVLTDLDTPQPGAGLATIKAVKEQSPTSMVIVLMPRKSFDDGVAAVRAGAVDIILKAPDAVPYLEQRVLDAVGRSVDLRQVDSVLSEVREVHEEFLERFIDAEKRALDAADRSAGRNPGRSEPARVLLVDVEATLMEALQQMAPSAWAFERAVTGGEALDRASSSRFDYVLVADTLADLPVSMVTRSIKAQDPQLIVLAYGAPGAGSLELIEDSRSSVLLQEFDSPRQLLDRLEELEEAARLQRRERRYLQAFRDRHSTFLRRYVELKIKIDRALSAGS